MQKKFFGPLIIGLLAGYNMWAASESDAIAKANRDIKQKRSLGDIFEDVTAVGNLLFKPGDPKWHRALLATLETLLDDLVERARQNKIKPDEKQEIIDSLTGFSRKLERDYGTASEFVRQLIMPAVTQIQQSPIVTEILPLPEPIAPGQPLPYETTPLPPIPAQSTIKGVALSMEQLSAQLTQLQQQVQRLKAAMPS